MALVDPTPSPPGCNREDPAGVDKEEEEGGDAGGVMDGLTHLGTVILLVESSNITVAFLYCRGDRNVLAQVWWKRL